MNDNKRSQQFLNNAENCAELAERATDEPTYKRYKLMEAGWLAMAREQDWLDGVTPPHRKASTSAVDLARSAMCTPLPPSTALMPARRLIQNSE